MRQAEQLDVEGADVEPGIERHDVDGDLQRVAVLGELGFQHAGGERRGVDRRLEARPQLDDGADVVFVRVRDDDAGEVGAVLLDEAHVGEDDVDAGVVLAFGEGDAAIDHQPAARILRPEAVEIGVHADLAEAAERQEHEFIAAGDAACTSLLLAHAPVIFRGEAKRRRRRS